MYLVMMDTFEVSYMEQCLQQLLLVNRRNLVHMGVGDYYWDTGTRYSLEHKTGSQAISESGQRLDQQLRKHLDNADQVGLIISNFVTPSPDGDCVVWTKQWSQPRQRWSWKLHETVHKSFAAYQGYLWQLQILGIGVFHFDCLDSMALGIAEFVFNSHKHKHTTLMRHLRPHARQQAPKNDRQQKVRNWKPDPFIETLMGIRNGNIGEARATKLIGKYNTPIQAMLADKAELTKELGPAAATKFLQAIGRLPK